MKRTMLVRPVLSERSTSYVRQVEPTKNQLKTGKVVPLIPPLIRGYDIKGQNRTVLETEKKEADLASILELSNTLSAADKKTLLAHLALDAQKQASAPDRDRDMWSRAVYEELLGAFNREGGAAQGAVLVKRSLTTSSAWAPIESFMQSNHLDALTVVQRQAIYVLLAKLLVESAQFISRRGRAPLSAGLVGSCAVNIASIFDTAFPGYISAGLVHLVAKQLDKRATF